MGVDEERRIVAYLLRHQPEDERARFEARLLEEPQLLDGVRRLEEELLAGRLEPRSRARLRAKAHFVAGLVIGGLLVVLLR